MNRSQLKPSSIKSKQPTQHHKSSAKRTLTTRPQKKKTVNKKSISFTTTQSLSPLTSLATTSVSTHVESGSVNASRGIHTVNQTSNMKKRTQHSATSSLLSPSLTPDSHLHMHKNTTLFNPVHQRNSVLGFFSVVKRLFSTDDKKDDKKDEKKEEAKKGDDKKEDDKKEETKKDEKKEKKDEKKKDEKKKDENKSPWSSIPKFDSLQFTPQDDPDKFRSTLLKVFLGVLVISQLVPVFTTFSRYQSRSTSIYREIFDQYLARNQVNQILIDGKTAIFHTLEGQISMDFISRPDFAARLALDIHQLGLHLPLQTFPEHLHQGPDFWYTFFLLQIVSFLPLLSKASSSFSSLIPGGRDDKIKPVKNLPTRFTDVAGMDEAKNEIIEFVDFLKDPAKYQKLGARLPKGALLSGPPGTGKTLLAKATAGEAGVSFFTVSGSEFQQMFVGVGAKRVRNLFKTARKHAPAIIFIDEIDSIAKQRSARGHEGGGEREATLNQLLVEMDGFNTQEAVVVFAATNRAEMLDSALTRAGRFDRKISVDTPDLDGREQIFNVHLNKLSLAHPQADVAKKIAALTPGMVGADIANVCNEAAIGAARRNNTTVELIDFETAVDKVVGGLEKKADMNNKKQRQVVAYHEAGHALLGWFLEYTDPLLKVTIVPRTNGALGFAQYLPKEGGLRQTEHLRDMIAMALGGRAAEDLVYNTISTGASDDLRQVARITQGMILRYGMSKKFANTAFATLDEDRQVWKSISQKTNFEIDQEIMDIVEQEYSRAKQLLTDKRHLLEKLGSELLLKETLNHEQLVAILGERPFQSDHYVKYVQSRKEFDLELKQEKEKGEHEKQEKEKGKEKGKETEAKFVM